MSPSGNFYRASKIVTPAAAHFCGNDIALIILQTNVPAKVATPVTPGVQYPLTDTTRYSGQITAIGYGTTAVGAQDEGTRRIKQDIAVQCIPGDKIIPCDGISGLTPNEFLTGAGTCSGDSGSGAYDQKSFDANNPITMGVLSRGGESGSDCVDAVYTRTDSFKDLIIETAFDAATTGGYTPPAWTNPPPGSDGTPQPGALGASCAKGADCLSSSCKWSGGATSVCTQTCTVRDDTTCPDGYTCQNDGNGSGFCFVDTSDTSNAAEAPRGATTTTATKACEVVAPGGPTNPAPWVFGLTVASGAVVRRRRPRR
jgi:hypothetical protein